MNSVYNHRILYYLIWTGGPGSSQPLYYHTYGCSSCTFGGEKKNFHLPCSVQLFHSIFSLVSNVIRVSFFF
jgi:hypothetical protein